VERFILCKLSSVEARADGESPNLIRAQRGRRGHQRAMQREVAALTIRRQRRASGEFRSDAEDGPVLENHPDLRIGPQETLQSRIIRPADGTLVVRKDDDRHVRVQAV
jgi:hypothetical protein